MKRNQIALFALLRKRLVNCRRMIHESCGNYAPVDCCRFDACEILTDALADLHAVRLSFQETAG